ncbi:SpaH/EbpB family LPXTG-anchored major pilin [Corynebacterium sp. H113]|uniref:SpaH/EbpB family LPXTG-anchored major pilin n=1 Tax=Corynebacterium sp. H113 TaxID=3133419 RepID=UPI0030AA2C21
MNKTSRLVRSATFAAIAGLSLTMGAPAAMAAPAGEQSNAASQGDSTITQDKGSLTIHKYADPSTLGNPTGNVDDLVSGTKLDDVEFTIYKINDIDLTTNEGLAAAANINVNDYLVNGTADLTKVTQQGAPVTTANGGQAVFDALPLGAYLVVETKAAEGYSPAAPFIAFVPMTQGNAEAGGTTWNYDVHAYPKNYQQKMPEKTVEDDIKNVGDVITYKVTGYAQTIADGQSRTIFRIEDTLDAALTPPAPEDVTVDGFVAGTDYTVTVEGRKVTINFTPTGLAKIENGQAITATIPATVAEKTDGTIENTAKVFENDPNTNQETEPKDTPTVKTYYAGIQFTKVNAGGTVLEGAEFQVYGATTDQTCDEAIKVEDQLQNVGLDNTSLFTSGADGVVTIDGLHVNNIADSTEGKANTYAKYCLVETKAPEGYELLADPIEFTLASTEAGTLKPITVGDKGEGKVVNLEDTTPNLPMTGGAGVGILAAIGAAIVAAGAWFARRNSSKA